MDRGAPSDDGVTPNRMDKVSPTEPCIRPAKLNYGTYWLAVKPVLTEALTPTLIVSFAFYGVIWSIGWVVAGFRSR